MAVSTRTSTKAERKPKLAESRWLLLGFVVAVYAVLAAVAFTLGWSEYPELIQQERELMRGYGR